MRLSRCSGLAVLGAFAAVRAVAAIPDPTGWTYREFSDGEHQSVEAFLPSRDGLAILAINCSVSGHHTISIQYRPDPNVGLSMAPVILDWIPPNGVALSSRLIWEPHESAATARDGTDDRNASDVAVVIKNSPGTLRITAADIGGDPIQTLYDSLNNREAIGRVLDRCQSNLSHPRKIR